MFVIITYDIANGKRVNKVRKTLKKYLTWTQNSVFEGKITDSKLKKCIYELDEIINYMEDSIYIYKVPQEKNIIKNIYGVHRNFDDMFL